MGSAHEVAACLQATRLKEQVQGIMHASGLLQDALISRQCAALVREVYAPKVPGSRALMQVQLLALTLPPPEYVRYSGLNIGLYQPLSKPSHTAIDKQCWHTSEQVLSACG